MLRRVRSALAGRFWGRALAGGGPWTWASEPLVRRAINERVTGSPDLWPIAWLAGLLGPARLQSAVSLGCGTGALERDLAAKGLAERILGLDISRRALGEARRLAAAAGCERIAYRPADLNRLRLAPGAFDGAFFHHALHHVEAVEACLDALDRALVPGSLVYLDEYVGPSRREWRRELLADAEAVYRRLPPSVRRGDRLPPPRDRRDPTEAIRSSAILPAVRARFVIDEERPYGGNFLAVIYPHLRLEHLDDGARASLLAELLAAEGEHLAAGADSYCAVVVARTRAESRTEPDRGVGSALATPGAG